MSRAAVAAFAVLVAATFAAFFVAQRLKGAPPVVQMRHAASAFSPNGDRRRDVERFALVVRHPERLTVDVVDDAGGTVRRLAEGVAARPSVPVRLRWDGRSDDGAIVPDGLYRARVNLGRSGRTVTASHVLRVDTRPPRPYVRAVSPGRIAAPHTPVTFAIGNPGRTRATRVTLWRTDLPTPRRVAGGVVAGGQRGWAWDGEVAGSPAPPGLYLAQLERADSAGNLARVPAQVPTRLPVPGTPGVTVRALAAQPPPGPVTAGTRVPIEVDSRRRPYTWGLRRFGVPGTVARGRGRGTPLRLRAPQGRSGLYVLTLRSGRAATRVPLLVQAQRRAKLLVVVPSLTWLGSAAVDDDGDGQADTLARGEAVHWPRVLPELPGELRHAVGPLLSFLDRSGVRYDLTSDLALALADGPRATDRPAVLLAGGERWIPVAYGRRLRRYVQDGGRLASIATESLRRGVTLLARSGGASGTLSAPTQPVDRDPFGARLEGLWRLPGDAPLEPIAGSATAPLLAFWDGTLSGFSAAERSLPPAPGDAVELVAGVGVAPGTAADGAPEPPKPALTQARIGRGTVIRIGVAGWAARVTSNADVAQLTRNAVDILVGARPRPRDLGRLAPVRPAHRPGKKPTRRRARRG